MCSPATEIQHGSDSNVTLLPCQTKFKNYITFIYGAIFGTTSELESCLCRTAVDTAEARRLNWANTLINKLFLHIFYSCSRAFWPRTLSSGILFRIGCYRLRHSTIIPRNENNLPGCGNQHGLITFLSSLHVLLTAAQNNGKFAHYTQ